MLSLGSFHGQPQCCVFNYCSISHLLPLFSKIPQPQLFFPSNRVTHLNIGSLVWIKRTGVCIFAVKGEEKGANGVVDMEILDDGGGDDVDGFLVDEDDVDEEDDDDEVIVPLRNMKKWLENKPRGFGVGKEYDTSIEDKLVEEIEQSKKAQLANINKLKNNPVKPNSKEKLIQQDKDVQDGFRVRLVNLPKKMNVDKDLRAAFKGVPGIANIVPVVSGNKKTRDPVCKGLAYINFKSEDEAKRFVEVFSGRSISFGKVEKQIKCEMIKPGSPKTTTIQPVAKIAYAPEEEIPDLHGGLDDDFDADILSSNSEENISVDYSVADIEDLSTNDYIEISSAEIREESESSKQEKKVEAKEEKKKPKRKKEVSKLNIPGSARKLKLKEKSLLTGVLSKYAQKSTVSTVEEQS